MKKLQLATGVIAAVAAAALVASSAVAGTTRSAKAIPFTAKYAGTAVVRVTDQVADISATGSGTGTLLGAGKLTGKGSGDASQQPCVPFGGTGTLAGKGGTLAFRLVSGAQGCGDEAGQSFAISGHVAVVKGTGKLAKTRGSLKFTGTWDRGSGSFTVKFLGSLSA
jgi:hypothetical protein